MKCYPDGPPPIRTFTRNSREFYEAVCPPPGALGLGPRPAERSAGTGGEGFGENQCSNGVAREFERTTVLSHTSHFASHTHILG